MDGGWTAPGSPGQGGPVITRLSHGNGRTVSWTKWIRLGVRISLGALFAYAGAVKIGSPQPFADSIASFRLLPEILISPLALGLPPLEILLGLWLASGWRRREAAFSALVLAVVFLLALGSAYARGLAVDCGCFGSEEDPILGSRHTAVAIGRDLLLLLTAAFLYASARKRENPTR